jgi:hypothetical protein
VFANVTAAALFAIPSLAIVFANVTAAALFAKAAYATVFGGNFECTTIPAQLLIFAG